jgi:hypothetical protein
MVDNFSYSHFSIAVRLLWPQLYQLEKILGVFLQLMNR